jgi:ketosteroid isomerase-like protein
MRILSAALILAVSSVPAAAAPQSAAPAAAINVAPGARAAAAIVDRFHAELRRGDTVAALALLTPEALIFESGRAERSKAEYAAHHLGADAAFSKAIPSKLMRRIGRVAGDTAWIASEGRTTGTFRGRAIDSTTTETMVLRRTRAGWRIVHIHWSSGDVEG